MEFITKNLTKIILGITLAVSLFLAIKHWRRIKRFLLEVKTELSRVSWSTKQELIGATTVVIVVTFLLAVFIGGIDFVLSKFLSVVIK